MSIICCAFMLILAACDGKDPGPAVTTETSTVVDTAAPGTDPFGTDDDGDGFTEHDGDCDDANPLVHVAAEDTPGDGVDSDCDNADSPSRWAALADGSYDEAGFGVSMGLGRTLAVGDADLDGTADVFVGAPGSSIYQTQWGAVYHLDGSSLTLVTTWMVSSELDNFGAVLALHDDLTGDGQPDLLAASGYGPAAYVLPASVPGADLLLAPDYAIVTVLESSERRPKWMSVGPDWNGDGVPELVVSMYDTTPVFLEDGIAFLGVLESPYPAVAVTADLTVVAGGTYGTTMSVDLDGDGVDEIAANDLTTGNALYLFDGPTDAPDPVYEAATLVMPLAHGDLDGNGVEDLVISSWNMDDPVVGVRAGRGVIVNRKPAGTHLDPFLEPLQIHAAGSHDWMGSSAAVGDFDGDAQLDLAMAAAGDPYFSDLPGRVQIWLGPITGPLEVADAWFVAHGESPADYFGDSVAAGDVDGDGLDDLVVGAPQWSDASGRVYLFTSGSM